MAVALPPIDPLSLETANQGFGVPTGWDKKGRRPKPTPSVTAKEEKTEATPELLLKESAATLAEAQVALAKTATPLVRLD